MKNRIFILGSLLAIAAISLSSCVNEEFTPGDPDVDGCYGVYFPDQNTSLTLDPDDDLELTLSVKRTNTADAITVPYTLTDESGIFNVEDDIVFASGQDSTSVLVTFANAEMGTTYTCTISIEDPKYYSVYSSNASGIDISVLRDKWNDLGTCLYTDDYFTTFWAVDNVTWEVPVQESDLNPGLYRLEYPYDGKYIYNDSWETDPDDYAYGEADWDTSETYWFTVNAQDPDGVYIDLQPIGVDWGYGMIYAYSYAAYYLDNGYSLEDAKSAGVCGTLKNGYITFPESDLLIYMPGYSSSIYYANNNGAFKIVLPGAADYSIEITADECTGGEAPLHFELGEDVDHVRYQIYEGSLKESEVTTYADEIAADSLGVASLLLEAEDINVTLDETGIYTLVAVSFDDTDEAQENASCEFCYLAAGDEMPVSIGVDFYNTNKYAADGNTSNNTFEFCIYGSDLTDVKFGLVKTESYQSAPAAYLEAVKEQDSVDSDVLKAINASGGYSGLYTGMVPVTSYTFIVWASNGYESTFVTAEAETTGTWVEYGTGDYEYGVFFSGSDPGLTISYLDNGTDNPTSWKISDWCYGVDLLFDWDAAKGSVLLHETYTGYYYSYYGENVYVDDIADDWDWVPPYYGYDYTDYTSYYDEDEKTFHFGVIYYGTYYLFNWGFETFTLNDNAGTNAKPSSVGKSKTFSLMTNMEPVKLVKTRSEYDKVIPVESHDVRTASFTVKTGTPSAKTTGTATAAPSSVNKSKVSKARRLEGLF